MENHLPNPPALDPELAADVVVRSGAVSRREALRKTGLYGLALASSPLALAALSKEAYGQGLPAGVRSALEFALLLEHLEYEFYAQGVATANLIPTSERALFTTIRDHEEAHVRFLQTVLGLTPGVGPGSAQRPPNGFDFTGARAGLNLNTFQSYQTFLAVSQGLEDTGVRAYKGQAGNVMSSDVVLEAALNIHSVEARHASAVRRVRGQKGWITRNQTDLPAAFAPIYAGEEATVSVGGSFTAEQISEAFDEVLTEAQVTAIATVFIRA